MDAMEGGFMAKAYACAFASPIRKVFYNVSIASLCVFVALFVGVTELAQILIQVLGLHGGVYGAVATSNVLVYTGYVIVVAFVITWAAALVIYKVRRIDESWGAEVDKVA